MEHSPSISHDGPSPWKVSRVAVLVLILGFVIRLYSLSSIPIFNPDGFLYIQQAKALYYKLFGSVLSCYEYLSNYPIFIAMSYKIFGNWVTAAQCVSLFFGTMTLIPSYWLVRRFFSETTSSIAMLCLALVPPFILVSRDVLRGPVYWFFSMMGLYLFILSIEKRNRLYPLLSSICFIMGTWARIEGNLFIFVSLIFLLLSKHERRWQSLLYFTIPFILLCTIFGIFLYFADLDILPMLKLERIMTQKWIAAQHNSIEAWVDHRRTGYPLLPFVYQNDSNADFGVIDDDDFLKRVPIFFGNGEQVNNPVGYADAVTKLGGPDLISTRLWWDTGGPNF